MTHGERREGEGAGVPAREGHSPARRHHRRARARGVYRVRGGGGLGQSLRGDGGRYRGGVDGAGGGRPSRGDGAAEPRRAMVPARGTPAAWLADPREPAIPGAAPAPVAV